MKLTVSCQFVMMFYRRALLFQACTICCLSTWVCCCLDTGGIFMSNQEKMGVTKQTNNINQLLHACNLTGRSVGCPGVKGCLLADVIKPVVVLSRYY